MSVVDLDLDTRICDLDARLSDVTDDRNGPQGSSVDLGQFREGARLPIETARVIDYGSESRVRDSKTATDQWPELNPAAYHGLAGEVVHTIAPHTEGDRVAILMNFLVMFGSAVGSAPHASVGATRHSANLFVVQVGETARARKGTAHDEALRLMRLADPEWGARVMGGLSTGEGLIHAVRDATRKINKEGTEIVDDPGVDDKRLLAVEPEFSSVLRVAARDGNTITEVIRRAWDGHDLRVMTRSLAIVATNPHISLLGHITRDELLRLIDATDQLNGFANRFLFLCVRRSQLLPHGGSLTDPEVLALGHRVTHVLHAAKRRGYLRRDADANHVWEAVYPVLTADRPGMLGAVTARAEAQVLRLSMLYALLDDAPAIQRDHLRAALALWQYGEHSAALIFGDATGDPIADRVVAALRANGTMTQTALSDLFGRHVRAAALGRALEVLVAAGKVRSLHVETGGRPRIDWEAVP
jgi:hypothetical protein